MLPKDIWKQIKVVFFSAEGTIFHVTPSRQHIYAKIYQRFGFDVSSERLHDSFCKAWEEHLKRRGKTWLKPELCIEEWRRIFSDTISIPRKLLDFEEIYRDVYEVFPKRSSYELSPGVKEVFSFLKASGRKVAIISNWDEHLFGLLKEFGLFEAFDEVFVGCEVGITKPNVKIFKFACKRLGVEPKQALMVGDQIEEDIIGARRAGLWALRYTGGDLRTLFLNK